MNRTEVRTRSGNREKCISDRSSSTLRGNRTQPGSDGCSNARSGARRSRRLRAGLGALCMMAAFFSACDKDGDGDHEKAERNVATVPARSSEPDFIQAASGPDRPFSSAVRANGFLILSGQIGTDSSGKVVAGGIQAETRQTMENIKGVLVQNGSSIDRVVKCTVFLADMSEWAAMNDIYVTFFSAGRRPARSAMGANGLALGAHVEIECLALDR